MINRELYNLTISDFTIELLSNKVPSDEKILSYKDVFDSADIAADQLYYSNLIRQMRSIVKMIYSQFTKEAVDLTISQTISKISTLIYPINKEFFFKYLSAAVDLESPNVEHDDKVILLEDMLSTGDVNNPAYEIIVYNHLLGLYLNDVEKYYDKLNPTSNKIKELTLLRDAFPNEILRP